MKRALGQCRLLTLLLAGCAAAAPRAEPPSPGPPAPATVTAPAPALAAPRGSSTSTQHEAAPAAEAAYSTPLLDERELALTTERACQAARAARRPVLLEFSAPWCGDCVALEHLKKRSPLAEELEHWELLPINVGSGEAHPRLMRAFQVRAIALLVVLSPSHCSAPLESWRRGAARTLDGLRQRGAGAGSELSSWLARERSRTAPR